MPPWVVRHLLIPVHEALLRRVTGPYLRHLMRTQNWPIEHLRGLQVRKLRELLMHAWRRCPAYRERIAACGIRPATCGLDDLARLQPITKDELRAAWLQSTGAHAYCDPLTPGGLHPYSTGGSTGEPLLFYVDRRRQAADQAARARSRRWFGIGLGERELYLWGAPIELRAQQRARFLRDRLANHRLVSAFDMTPASMNAYLQLLERYRPAHIFGYPSSLARLAFHARSTGRTSVPSGLRAVFVTGEVLMPADRETIRDFFRAPVADGYGSREAGFIAHECPHGGMHVTMESLIVELLDSQGRRVPEGESGEITVTHLDAYGMPFIRYRTGDLARIDLRPCACGMPHTTLAGIEGRRGDAIRSPNGNAAHPLSVVYPLRECPHVRQFRVIQRRDGRLEVLVVPMPGFTEATARHLEGTIAKQFSNRLGVAVRSVSAIPSDPSGKHRIVHSECEPTGV